MRTLIRTHLYEPIRKKIQILSIKTFSLIYHRFIDDIFFIGTGCKTDLENFLNELNINKNKIFRKKADC